MPLPPALPPGYFKTVGGTSNKKYHYISIITSVQNTLITKEIKTHNLIQYLDFFEDLLSTLFSVQFLFLFLCFSSLLEPLGAKEQDTWVESSGC